jgi:serine/threonine protein kinase
MLVLNPSQRFTARQALSHHYFTTDPLPSESSDLPKIEGEIHEYQISQKQMLLKQNMSQSLAAKPQDVYNAKNGNVHQQQQRPL